MYTFNNSVNKDSAGTERIYLGSLQHGSDAFKTHVVIRGNNTPGGSSHYGIGNADENRNQFLLNDDKESLKANKNPIFYKSFSNSNNKTHNTSPICDKENYKEYGNHSLSTKKDRTDRNKLSVHCSSLLDDLKDKAYKSSSEKRTFRGYQQTHNISMHEDVNKMQSSHHQKTPSTHHHKTPSNPPNVLQSSYLSNNSNNSLCSSICI